MHPSHFVTETDVALVDLWMCCQGGEFAAAHLPFAGGVADQPCYLMEAFAIIGAVVEGLKPPRPTT